MSTIAGIRLKRLRTECRLTCREVERLSRLIADRHQNPRFIVRISVLARIEKDVVPNIFHLCALCIIYSVEMHRVLSWYGLPDRKVMASIKKWLANPSQI